MPFKAGTIGRVPSKALLQDAPLKRLRVRPCGPKAGRQARSQKQNGARPTNCNAALGNNDRVEPRCHPPTVTQTPLKEKLPRKTPSTKPQKQKEGSIGSTIGRQGPSL